MVRHEYELDAPCIVLPITQKGREIAQQFSEHYLTALKAEQVRLNSLAVWVVNDYLSMLGIPTNLSKSDSWNPLMHLAGNISDLEIDGLGKLECRPIMHGEEQCLIPPETWTHRIGYLVVEIDHSLRNASLLGFVQSIHREFLLVHELRPLDELIDYLYELRVSKTELLALETQTVQPSERIYLHQWFDGLFATGWQRLEDLLNPENLDPVYAFRSHESQGNVSGTPQQKDDTSVVRAKLINLGIQLGPCTVILMARLRQEVSDKTEITLQLHPEAGQAYLVPSIELKVLDPSGAVFMQTQARETDNYIQLKFSGEEGEHFDVAITLDDVTAIEHFLV